MVDRGKIIEKLTFEGNKISELFSSFSKNEWEILLYFDEMEWQVKDLLAQFISSVRSFLLLFENIRLHDQGAPEHFSIIEFNNLQVTQMKEIQVKELVELFRKTRDKTVNWVKVVNDSDLEKVGRHPAMGEAKIVDMVKMIYLHNQMHLRDLALALKNQKKF